MKDNISNTPLCGTPAYWDGKQNTIPHDILFPNYRTYSDLDFMREFIALI